MDGMLPSISHMTSCHLSSCTGGLGVSFLDPFHSGHIDAKSQGNTVDTNEILLKFCSI